MPVQSANFCHEQPAAARLLRLLLLVTVVGQASHLVAQETPQQEAARLIDLRPFDRITLKAAHRGEIIDTLPLDLPNRQLPASYPIEGKLKLKRVSQPSVLYTVPWEAIEEIDLFEYLVLAKAVELTTKKDFAEAYAHLEFLHKYYPQIEGLQSATEQYLKRDALSAFSSKRYDESLTILIALYDLNPDHKGLAAAVQAVTDRLISTQLASQDFGAARTALDSVESTFSQLKIRSIDSWRKKFQQGAEKQLAEARNHLEQGDFREARQAIRQALAILPSVADAKNLSEEINRRSPQVVVGVAQHSQAPTSIQLATVAESRIANLTRPQFVQLSDFGGEGGVYTCRWADLQLDDSGLQFDLQLNQHALAAGISPEALSLQLMQSTDSSAPAFRADIASLLQTASTSNGTDVRLQWLWPHVRPEALLQFPLQDLATNPTLIGAYQLVSSSSDPNLLVYDQPQFPADKPRPPSIVEQIFPSEEQALTALVRGEVDLLQRISPWQVDRLRGSDGIVVGSYRLPTIHLLLPNYSKPLIRRREFRRALCYGIDRQRIVKDIILGGKNLAGVQVLSGPLPAGVSLSDPLGYAYQRSLKPRPYEPRLAAVLATVARSTLAQPAKQGESSPDVNSAGEPPPDKQETSAAEIEPLVLLHPPDELARTTCRTIKLQLDAIGIPIKLAELSPNLDANIVDHDLQYVEFPLWEPLIDLDRLLGPSGRAGTCTPAMSLALAAVHRSRNWKEARTRLQHVHEVAFYDLPAVPLWQTVNFFARRETLQGIGSSPVWLYQDVADWKTSFMEAAQ